jgi:hypothetical protein
MKGKIYTKICFCLSVLLVIIVPHIHAQISDGKLSRSLSATETISQNHSGGTHEFLSSSSITASNVISDGATVHYGALMSVRLLPGFKVNANCNFRADLQGSAGSSLKSVTNQTTSAQASNLFMVYPNPNNGSFTIETHSHQLKQVEVFDVKGARLVETTFTSPTEALQIPDAVKGVYMLRVIIGNDVKTERIIVQ